MAYEKLAIFDLDNTLLIGDSDHAWGEFLIAEGMVDQERHQQKNDQFYQDYCKGELDIHAYQAFALSAIKGRSPESLIELHQKYMSAQIETMIGEKAVSLINSHRQKNHQLLIITATNDFITTPIAKRLGIDSILSCQAEIIEGKYTGHITGTPCFQEGKVIRLNKWLQDRPFTLNDCYFYSDSHNDLPLLEAVAHPTAIDPVNKLREHATQKGWPILSLR